MAIAGTFTKEVTEKQTRVVLDLSLKEAKVLKHAMSRVQTIYGYVERKELHTALDGLNLNT